MKIGVVGDTHRNTEYLTSVAQWMAGRQNVSALYHLGDDYEDVAAVADLGIDIVQVPGIYHRGYRDGSLPAKTMETVLGVRILLLHCLEKDLGADDALAVDIILHAHTHVAEMALRDGHFYMNPGHLKGERDKTMLPSFGMIDILDNRVVASIHNMKFRPEKKMEMIRTENGLYKAS